MLKKLITVLMTALFSLSIASFVLAQEESKEAPKKEVKKEKKEKKEKKKKKAKKEKKVETK